MNTYLLNIYSIRLLNDEINKITAGKENIVNINYDESNIDNVLDECAYFSLLNEEKIVIVKNFKINASSKALEKYLDNPNPNTKLILVVDSVDKRSTIYKKIKDKGNIIEIAELKPNELANKVNNYAKSIGVSIDYSSVNKLIEYNLNNYDLILNEIDKISIVTNKITSDIVDAYSSKLNGEDTFGLCDAITSKDYKNASKLVDSFIAEKMEVVPLVALLAGQYRIIYATKELNESNESIASKLNIHPYRVKLAKEKAYLYSKDELKSIILNLCDLDKNLKSLNVNQYTLLKEFFIKLI